MPKLSILTVVYNSYVELEQTLDSIREQTFLDKELIVIDGGSSDGTLDIIKTNDHLITKSVSAPDDGIYHAMNKALELANGEYVQFLNAGDIYADSRVLSDVFSLSTPNVTLIYGDINIILTTGKSIFKKAEAFNKLNLIEKGTGILCHQAMFIDRGRCPFYSLQYKYKAELNWYFDLLETNDFEYYKIDRSVVNYALGGKGYQNFIRNRIDWIRVVIDRFGFSVLLQSGLLLFLAENAISRYDWLNQIAITLKNVRKFISK